MRQLSLKTRVLNFFRLLLMNRVAEPILYRLVRNKEYKPIWYYLLPNHYQYKPGSIRIVQRSGINFRLDISDIVDWYTYFDLFELAHKKILTLIESNDVILDIGANIGSTGLKFGQKVHDGAVYCFEPDVYNYQKLTANLALNKNLNVLANQMAVGSNEGFITLGEPDIHNRGKNSVDVNGESDIKIPLITVDLFVTKQNVKRVDVLKIDVEGFESEVLLGAAETIRTHRPKIMIELDENNLQKYGSSIEKIVTWLGQFDYRIEVPDLGIFIDQLTHDDFSNFHYDAVCTYNNIGN